MKKRIIRLSVFLIVAVATAAIVLSYLQEPPPSQIITLSNGEQFRLTGVTYGTEHVQGPTLARLVNHLPAWLASFLRRKMGSSLGTAYSFQTPQPALGVWLEPLNTNAGPRMVRTISGVRYMGGVNSQPAMLASEMQALLADENGVLAGKFCESASQSPLPTTGSVPVIGVTPYIGTFPFPNTGSGPFPIFFPLVPRRSRTLECRFFTVPPGSTPGYQTSQETGGSSQELGRVHFPNPAFGRFSAWKPEPLPATQRTGELEVRLEHFTTGKPAPGTRFNFLTGNPSPGTHLAKFEPAKKGQEAWTGFDFTLRSPPEADAAWALHSADLSDAGGNHLRRFWSSRNQWPYQFMTGTLWPDEAAWRLKLEFKRKSGFTPAQLVTFTNVLLLTFGVPGPILQTNTVNGLQLVLMEYSSVGPYYSTAATITPLFRIETPSLEGTAFDFVQLVTDQGETMAMREMPDTSRAARASLTPAPRILIFSKEPPTNATTVNLTWAVQKTRSVEFLVQPPQP